MQELEEFGPALLEKLDAHVGCDWPVIARRVGLSREAENLALTCDSGRLLTQHCWMDWLDIVRRINLSTRRRSLAHGKVLECQLGHEYLR